MNGRQGFTPLTENGIVTKNPVKLAKGNSAERIRYVEIIPERYDISYPVVQHIEHLLICDPRILNRVSDVSVAKLPLYSGDVASLFDYVSSHGMPGCMGGFVADLGYAADLVPHFIDHKRFEPTVTVAYCRWRQEEGN